MTARLEGHSRRVSALCVQPGGGAGARGAVVTGTIDELTRKALSCMLRGAAGWKPMSIDAEEAAIRTVIVGALMGRSEAGERGSDALLAMRQCGFRRMRTVIPIDCGQRFRSIADSVP